MKEVLLCAGAVHIPGTRHMSVGAEPPSAKPETGLGPSRAEITASRKPRHLPIALSLAPECRAIDTQDLGGPFQRRRVFDYFQDVLTLQLLQRVSTTNTPAALPGERADVNDQAADQDHHQAEPGAEGDRILE